MKLILSMAGFALLSGCAAAGGPYPSLAKRPFETSLVAPALPPATPATPTNTEIVARVARFLAEARASVAPFDDQLAKAQAPVAAASGTEQGSEAWITAQVAVSRLESLRSPAANAAAAIGDEYRMLMLVTPGPDLATVEAALIAATAIADRQSQEMDRLTERLSR